MGSGPIQGARMAQKWPKSVVLRVCQVVSLGCKCRQNRGPGSDTLGQRCARRRYAAARGRQAARGAPQTARRGETPGGRCIEVNPKPEGGGASTPKPQGGGVSRCQGNPRGVLDRHRNPRGAVHRGARETPGGWWIDTETPGGSWIDTRDKRQGGRGSTPKRQGHRASTRARRPPRDNEFCLTKQRS